MIGVGSGNRTFRFVLTASVLASVVLALFAGSLHKTPTSAPHRFRAHRIVLFTMPGVTWGDIRSDPTPVLHRLAQQGATAALAPRGAGPTPNEAQGYLTLGAGNRAATTNTNEPNLAYPAADEALPGVTADDELTQRVGAHRAGAVVHVGMPALGELQRALYHGAVAGALGEALARAHVMRAVVSAGDESPAGVSPITMRGASVLALSDTRGVVDEGTIRGLVYASPHDAFGVRTDERAFAGAVSAALSEARVVLVDPGETERADEFASKATPERARALRRVALTRTDTILGDIVKRLRPADLLIVVSPSSATSDTQEHLTAVLAWGSGVGAGMLSSPSTRRAGIVTLTDVAPTVLGALGIEAPPSMSGHPFDEVSTTRADRPAIHYALDRASVFRERFSPAVFYTFVGCFVVLTLLVGLVLLARVSLRWLLGATCYLVLAVPLASFLLASVPVWQLGIGAGHVILWGAAIALAALASLVPGPRWSGAIVLLGATAAFIAADLLSGGTSLVNAIFGNSVLSAGRFYGVPNTGSAIFFGATVLALAGVGHLWPVRRSMWWLVSGLVVMLALTGLPPYGADFGGLLAGIVAAAIIVVLARGGPIPWRAVIVTIVAAIVLTMTVAYLDSLRPLDHQTHLGRFAEALINGHGTATMIVKRKLQQSVSSLGFSRFTFFIPLGLGTLAVLLHRPRGPLQDAMPAYPLLRAALIGLLAGGVLGFGLNDSGVAVPALLLAQAVPVLVLVALQHLREPTAHA